MNSPIRRLTAAPSRFSWFCSLRALPLALAALSLSSVAGAQSAFEDEFSVQRFDPPPGPRNFITTRGVRTDDRTMTWSGGLMLNYSYLPFVVRSCAGETDCDNPNLVQQEDVKVIENMLTGDLLFSLVPLPKLELGAKLPLTWVDGQGITESGSGDLPDGLSAVGLGDFQVEGKYRVYGEMKDPYVLGAGAFVSAPLGTLTSEGHYIGDPAPNFGLRGIFDGLQGPLSFGANLAVLYRGSGRIGTIEIGPFEFRYGVAGGYAAGPVLRVVADAFGTTKFSSKNGTNSLELDAAAQIVPYGSPLAITAGAGFGLIEGVGVPVVRGFAGVLYVAEGRDRDGDGLGDDVDQCPTAAEDKDGYEDSDGCPDVDNDGDSIDDSVDKCPDRAEDMDGFEDTDGCVEADNDQDGVLDDHDACRNEPETKNGFKDEDGCPDEPDTDGDGVVDVKDQCKTEVEDTDGFQDEDGCPDPDNDGDGIPDDQDECIDQPETKDGIDDEDGCPEGDAATQPAPSKPGAPAPAAPAR